MFLPKQNILKYHLPLFTLGFTTNIVQVILIREIVNTFYSNELIIGILLAFWMSLTGLGAWIGSKKVQYSDKSMFIRFLILSLLPIILVILLPLFRYFFFLPGELVNIWKLIPFIIILLLPYCILSGNVFTYISVYYRSYETESGKLYSIESAGSILGGLVVGLIMVLWLNAIQSLAINCYLVLIIAIICYFNFNSLFKIVTIIVLLIIPVLSFVKDYDRELKQLLFRDQFILKTNETPYGNLTFTSTSGQVNVFENQNLLFFSENVMAKEEAAHYAMLQRNKHIGVLLIGGGISGIAGEILKYPSVKYLNYVESNPWLLKYSYDYFSLPKDDRLRIFRKDGRTFIKRDSSMYDIIILSVGTPSSLQLNRYYTIEFFQEIKKHCNKNAVFSLSIASSENYMNAENKMLHSVIYKTLKKEFSNVIVLPGEKDYFLASDDTLTCKIAMLYDQSTIKNEYVNSGFIDDISLSERSNSIMKAIQDDVYENKDFEPVATNIETSFFFSRFNVNVVFLIFVVVAILLIPVFKLQQHSVSMYVTGFTASALEMIILMLFQIMFGFLYAAAGVLFAVFMFGLAIGSWRGIPLIKNAPLVLQVSIAVLAFLVPILLIAVNKININAITYPLFFVCIFAVALITGMQYANQVKQVDTNSAAGYTYGVDLAGSALGVLSVSVLLIPVFGLFLTTLVLVVVNVFAIVVLKISDKRMI